MIPSNFQLMLIITIATGMSLVNSSITYSAEEFPPPTWDEFREQLDQQLPAEHPVNTESFLGQCEAIWQSPVTLRLSLFEQQIAAIFPAWKTFESELKTTTLDKMLAHSQTLTENLQYPLLKSNLFVLCAHRFMQRELLEECQLLLNQCNVELVIDPATYFFCKAVCEHHLLEIESAQSSLDQLLDHCGPIPDRYRNLGELMRYDLKNHREKSLGEVAKKMTDVERRLQLGRSGEKVQKKQQEIIETLDEIIKKLEEQQGGASSSGAGSSNQSQQAANESRIKGSTAPGDVDDKNLGTQDGWGNLPDKEKSKAKQVIKSLFPPHYEKAIEAFNRKAAQRPQSP